MQIIVVVVVFVVVKIDFNKYRYSCKDVLKNAYDCSYKGGL